MSKRPTDIMRTDWPGLKTQIVSGIVAQIVGGVAVSLMFGRNSTPSALIASFLIVVLLVFISLLLTIPFLATLIVELLPTYPRFTLNVLRSEKLRAPIVLETGEIVIGKKPEHDVLATGDRYVSLRHARLRHISGCVTITDMDSKNRTFVNEQPLTPWKEEMLADGDVIKMGLTEFRLEEDRGTPILKAIRSAAASLL